MYDYAHPLSDAIEGITHSLCTLEYEDHRPLYDWCIEQAETEHQPQQYEFARLNLNYTVMSKRKLLQLVAQKHVSGWDDPRMPTISGLRRRGYTPGVDPRLLHARRRGQEGERDRHRACSSTACARISTSARRARWPCCGR